MLLSLLLTAAFLALNALFVLAEYAIVKVRATRLEELARAGNRRAARAREVVRHLDEYLSVCQVGMTVASLGLGWIGEPALARLFRGLMPAEMPWREGVSHGLAVALAFCLLTFLHILLGELVPKVLAIRRAEAVALATAGVLKTCRRLFYLPMKALNPCRDLLLGLLGLGKEGGGEGTYSEQELKLILSLSERRGGLSLDRLLLFENLFDFGTLTARDAMHPIAEAERIALDTPWDKVAEGLRASRHSRLLAYGKDPAKPEGLVHVKDLWRASLAAPGQPPDLRAALRPLPALKEKDRLEQALREFQRARAHLAVVLNEKGAATGILALEDVLEELVGSIGDEFEAQAGVSLADLLAPASIRLDLQASDMRQVLHALSHALPAGLPAAAVEEGAWKREQEVPTYLGLGVAVPHARLDATGVSCLAFARLREGLAMQAGQDEPARLFFLVVTPKDKPRLQIQILARVADLVRSSYVRERLLAASTPEELMEVVRSAELLTHSD